MAGRPPLHEPETLFLHASSLPPRFGTTAANGIEQPHQCTRTPAPTDCAPLELMQLTDVERQRSGAAWFPQTLLRELAGRLAAASAAPGLGALREQLPAALARHRTLAAQQGELLANSTAAAMA